MGYPIEMTDRAPSRRPMMFSRFAERSVIGVDSAGLAPKAQSGHSPGAVAAQHQCTFLRGQRDRRCTCRQVTAGCRCARPPAVRPGPRADSCPASPMWTNGTTRAATRCPVRLSGASGPGPIRSSGRTTAVVWCRQGARCSRVCPDRPARRWALTDPVGGWFQRHGIATEARSPDDGHVAVQTAGLCEHGRQRQAARTHRPGQSARQGGCVAAVWPACQHQYRTARPDTAARVGELQPLRGRGGDRLGQPARRREADQRDQRAAGSASPGPTNATSARARPQAASAWVDSAQRETATLS